MPCPSALTSTHHVVGTCVGDLSHGITEFDAHFLEITGTSHECLLGLNFVDLVHVSDRTRVRSFRENLDGVLRSTQYKLDNEKYVIDTSVKSSSSLIHSTITDITSSIDCTPISVERFMSMWAKKPSLELAHFMGVVAGQLCSKDLIHFLSSFGASLFTKQHICDRIDWLFKTRLSSHKRFRYNDIQNFFDLDYSNGCIIVKGKQLDFANISIILMHANNENGAIHYGIKKCNLSECDTSLLTMVDFKGPLTSLEHPDIKYNYNSCEWNFRRHHPLYMLEGVTVYPYPGAFVDHENTLTIAHMITAVTNMMGFII